MQIHELPDVTAIGSGGYFATDNGSQTTKIDYDALAQAIIEQYASSTLAGTAQSVKAALDGIKTGLDVVYGANPIKTLAATDDLLTLDVGMYRVANVLPLNAPSTTYKYGYATKQHRGASGYTYYEFVVGNGNGNDFKRYYGWQYSNSATSIDWIEMAPQSAVDELNSKTAFIKSALNLTKVDSGGSKTFTVTSTTKSIMIAVAAEPNDQGMWFLNARSNGAVSVTAIRETSNITFTTGTNTLTINNASPANVFVAVIAFDGNGVTAQ